jgi:hypothetical protein
MPNEFRRSLSAVRFAANPRTAGEALASILEAGGQVLAQITAESAVSRPQLAVSRVRGTGRGVHFQGLVDRLEAERPVVLESPFEGSERVAGAVWRSESHAASLAKLRWSAGADDLPLHSHPDSDRFIIVQKGRGFFHYSPLREHVFDGQNVRTIPARERDVFIFTRGLLHTFSTTGHAMTLLSVQSPFLAFDDPKQYRLATPLWVACDHPDSDPGIGLDPLWSIIGGPMGS